MLHINVLGLARIAHDVTAEPACSTFETLFTALAALAKS
jgi:hypothetical protein